MNFLIFDTETTGLPLPSSAPVEKQPRIIEIGLAMVSHGDVVMKFNALLDPEQEVSAEITKITGITNEDVKGKPKFKELLPELKKLFGAADFLVAHNANFDRSLLEFELVRAECDDFPWPKETICTVQEYKHLFGFNPRLVDLYQLKMGKPLEQTHRALDDVLAVVEILRQDDFFSYDWKM